MPSQRRRSRRVAVPLGSTRQPALQLTVDGTLEADTYGGDFSAAENDTPTENPDGTLTRTDETGPVPDRASETNYLGDRFIVTGRVTELGLPTGADGSDVNVYLDEELVSRDDVVADGSS